MERCHVKHLTAAIYKLIITTIIVTLFVPWMEGATFGQSIIISLVVVGALYLLGDLFILPLFGNVSATLADAGVAYLLIRFAPMYTQMTGISIGTALLTASLIGVAEYFFHRYLIESVLPGSPGGRVRL